MTHYDHDLCQPATGAGLHARVTEVTICALPDDNINHHLYAVTIVWRGPGNLYAVTRMRECLDSNNMWDWEPSPSDRDDDWKATHRWPFDEAMQRAIAVAPTIWVNGKTAADIRDFR